MAMPAMACQGCQAAPSNFPSFTSSCRCSACSLQEVSELSPDWPNICLQNTIPHRFLELKRASILQNNTRPQQFPRFPPCFPMVFPNWNPGSAEPWRDGTPVHLAMISTGPFIDDLPMTIVIFHGKLSNYRGVLSPTQRNISAIDSRVESKFYCKLLGHLASWKVLGVPKDLPSRTSFLKRRRSQNHNSNHIWPLQVSVAFL